MHDIGGAVAWMLPPEFYFFLQKLEFKSSTCMFNQLLVVTGGECIRELKAKK